jgi:peroxiredoxin Q/BCP
MIRARFALAAVVAAGFAAAATAADDKLKVKVGDKFPDVALPATQIEKVKKDAKEVSVADLKGKVVVVFFYPKANTKG